MNGIGIKVLAVLLIMIFAGTAFALQPISVERQAMNGATAGGTVQVKLTLAFVGDKPNGIVVTEYIPAGWRFNSAIPSAVKFGDKASWLLYGSNVKDTTITYELTAPSDINSATPILGEWQTVSARGLISGAALLPLKQAETAAPPATQPQNAAPTDNNMLLYFGIGALVVIVIIIAAAAVMISSRRQGGGKAQGTAIAPAKAKTAANAPKMQGTAKAKKKKK